MKIKKTLIITTFLGVISMTGCCDCDGGHDHIFDQKIASEQFLASAATCNNAAQYYYSCECGEKDTTNKFSYGDALEHVYGAVVTIEAPTCSSKGVGSKQCKNCTHIENVSLPALTHYGESNWTTDENQHWHACINGCDEKFDLADHSFGELVETEYAQCEQKGSGYYICSVCNYKKDVETPALGHNPNDVYSMDENGHYYACKNIDCQEKLQYEAHDYDRHITRGATCTNGGYGHETCKICDYYHEFTLEPLGHSTYSGWDYNETQHWQNCKKCADKVNLANHTYDNLVVDTPSTCVTKGKGHYTCTTCNYKKEVELDYGNHDASTEWSTNETEHWHECANCDAKVGLANHNFGEVIVDYRASCTYEGTGHQVCQDCGYVKENVTIPINPNVHSMGTVWNSHDDYHYLTCRNCGCEIGNEEHDFIPDGEDTPATCSSKAVHHYICDVCGYKKDVEFGEFDPENHTYVYNAELSTTKSYTECGTDVYICSGCGDVKTVTSHLGAHYYQYVYKNEQQCVQKCTIEGCKASGYVMKHAYTVTVIDREPTETTLGLKHVECLFCGHTQPNSEVEFNATKITSFNISMNIPTVGDTLFQSVTTSSEGIVLNTEFSGRPAIYDKYGLPEVVYKDPTEVITEDMVGTTLTYSFYVIPADGYYFGLDETNTPIVNGILNDSVTLIPPDNSNSKMDSYWWAFKVEVTIA